MDTLKLDKWANLLLDTGKRNNLVNFKDTKTSTVEIILPSAEDLFDKVDSAVSFEVYNPKITDLDELEEDEKNEVRLNRQEYISKYSPRIKKNNQMLLYNAAVNPVNAIKSIDKKAREYVEETGVNVAYIAFGFIEWKEAEHSNILYKAPILLAPIEFENESAVSPWFIKMTEEDLVVNPTFSFKLENEYGIKLPNYLDDGLDTYLEKIRKMVTKLGWDVVKECKIGIFSFLKLNMYRDLKDNQDIILKKNNVRLLLGEPCEPSDSFSGSENHKIQNPLIELHNVVDADSSQIEAIQMAKAGKSFVLQGPPGTGKSQTITNIIAECINDGKKVLFVSEKQAALNVVYDKLKKAGLEEFCLELHSHKSNKKVVIEELCKTLKTAKTKVSSKADEVIESKKKSQIELDQYETELHKKRDGINCSLFQLYESYAACRKAPEINFTISDIQAKGSDYLGVTKNLILQYMDYIPSIGYEYKNNTWYGYVNTDTTYQTRESVKKTFEDLLDAYREFLSIEEFVEDKYGIEDFVYPQKAISFGNALKLISENDIITADFLKVDRCTFLCDRLKELSQLSVEIISIKSKIDKEYDQEIYQINAIETYKKLTRQFTNGFTRLFNSEYKKIITDIRLNRKDGKKPSYEMAVELFNDLCTFYDKNESYTQLEEPIKGSLGSSFCGINSNWDTIIKSVEQLKEILYSGISFGSIQGMTSPELNENKQDFSIISNRIASANKTVEANRDSINSYFDNTIVNLSTMSFEQSVRKLATCLNEFDKIDNWCGFYSLIKELEKMQLVEYIDTAITEEVPIEYFEESYRRCFYNQWIDSIIHSSNTISTFNRIVQDRRVETFVKQDETQFAISKVQIKSELSSKRPSLDMLAAGSAISILLREGEKKRKQKGIRVLMDEVGELIQLIKPCFLMSPLSVSTFLNPESIGFDVVIFDEASQIFPQDAIGAIYRGNQLIVVGDSKQMPPSNFFNATVDSDDSDEETGDVTDFESILDLCSTAFQQLRLKWHYRSRYEQLISFSNMNFYDNDLVTFPSSIIDKKGIGVDYYCVNGLFDHKSRNNRKEAEFIVDLIYDNIEKYPERSLGVVAFSVSQQDLIERLLSQRRLENPSKESFFSKSVAEPFFIKNLETVQGDERDTIIFSVAYAKDSTGRLMHNFGPLNRVGGERRLNVAVTRAKMNVQLVASIHYTDIDLSRTSAVGAKLLREYLDYAENGGVALERSITVNPFEQFDSDFELEICEFLRENGFEVDTQVGCSTYRIDLAIKKPGTSDYVLAVECDGATYHSSRNARDRDRLRQQILERMGWKFYRIWSTDWFRNNSVEKLRLLEVASKAVYPDKNSGNEKRNTSIDNNEKEFEIEMKESHLVFPRYKSVDCSYYSSYSTNFQTMVKNVLEKEAPLSEEWFLKRIPWWFGREKATEYVRKEYENRMYGCQKNGIIRRKGFLYLQDQTNYMLRIPGYGDDDKREIKYIALEELAAGMIVIIKQNITVDRIGMYKFLTKELGFQRMTENMQQRYDDALYLLRTLVDRDGDSITLRKN